MIDPLSVELVADANVEFVEAVEHVQLRQRDPADAARHHRLAHHDRVEPAAAALASGHRSELVSALSQPLAGLVLELGGERPSPTRVV